MSIQVKLVLILTLTEWCRLPFSTDNIQYVNNCFQTSVIFAFNPSSFVSTKYVGGLWTITSFVFRL